MSCLSSKLLVPQPRSSQDLNACLVLHLVCFRRWADSATLQCEVSWRKLQGIFPGIRVILFLGHRRKVLCEALTSSCIPILCYLILSCFLLYFYRVRFSLKTLPGISCSFFLLFFKGLAQRNLLHLSFHPSLCFLDDLPYDLAIPFLFTQKNWKDISAKDLCTGIHRSFIHNGPKSKTTQMSSKRWMNKQIIV